MADGSLIFVVGGARSGKSDFAVEAARRFGGPVTVVVTATAGDDDMLNRIEHHRRDRPAHWTVVEEPLEVVDAAEAVADDDVLIVDCLTMWTANAVFADGSDESIITTSTLLAGVLADRRRPTIVVSNEVGLGIHPAAELGRRYRDLLGRVNRAMAARASTTLFFVAGRAMRLDDPWELLAAGPEEP